MRRREENEDYITISGSSGDFPARGADDALRVSGYITGSISDINSYQLVRCMIDKYEIDVIVDSDNRFIGISEVRIKKDFLSSGQRIAIRSHIDLNEYYKD